MMELTSLSPMPHKPCLLLKCAKATILLDAAINLETLATFHPRKITGKYVPPELPETNGNDELNRKNRILLDHLIDATPEVQPVQLENVAVEEIDAILISNWSSLFGLPFITERKEFHGVVYCTVPTKELGNLAMYELFTFLTHNRSDTMTDEKRKTDFWKKFPNCKMLDPTKWQPVFTREELDRSMSRVIPISLGETKLINGIVKCTAYSSGHSIGSCNWIIEMESTKFGYIANSSAKPTHMRPSDWKPFRNLDYLALTSLTPYSDTDPYENCNAIRKTMANTLNKGGNVLFPVNPVGYIFDLLEVIFGALEEHRIARDVPVYLISPSTAYTLAFINIFTEWLKKEKAVKVYNPDEPFAFSELVRENRIKVYDTIYGAFSREYKTPCVVLTGHPTLHVGNVVNFLELWGQDMKSAIISTDPDYPIKEMYKPYRKLQIRAYDYPIETRLDMSYLNKLLLPELKPKTLIIPKEYITPTDANLAENSSILYNNIITFGDKPLSLHIASRKRALIHSDLLKTLNIQPKKAKMVSSCNLRGFLSTYDNDLKLVMNPLEIVGTKALILPSPKIAGILTPEKLIKEFTEHGIKAEYGDATAGECATVRIPNLKAEVRVFAGGQNSRICCSSSNNRRKIQKILMKCLEEL